MVFKLVQVHAEHSTVADVNEQPLHQKLTVATAIKQKKPKNSKNECIHRDQRGKLQPGKDPYEILLHHETDRLDMEEEPAAPSVPTSRQRVPTARKRAPELHPNDKIPDHSSVKLIRLLAHDRRTLQLLIEEVQLQAPYHTANQDEQFLKGLLEKRASRNSK